MHTHTHARTHARSLCPTLYIAANLHFPSVHLAVTVPIAAAVAPAAVVRAPERLGLDVGVEQLHQQADELGVLRGGGPGAVRPAEVAVQHGLQAGAQLPQQLPAVHRQLAAHQGAAGERHLHTLPSHWGGEGEKRKRSFIFLIIQKLKLHKLSHCSWSRCYFKKLLIY